MFCFSELQWRAADVLAVVSQNNPYSQKALTEMGVITILLQLVDNDPADQVKIKALYALSCGYIVRTNVIFYIMLYK